MTIKSNREFSLSIFQSLITSFQDNISEFELSLKGDNQNFGGFTDLWAAKNVVRFTIFSNGDYWITVLNQKTGDTLLDELVAKFDDPDLLQKLETKAQSYIC